MSDYTKDYYDVFWEKVIKNLPRGGSYNFIERQEQMNKIKDIIKEGSTVFDYACGLSMHCIQLVKEKNCKTFGCDFSKVAVDYANEKTKGDYRVGDKIFGGPYDYMIVSHYLEHIKNPREFIENCFIYTDKVIVAIPNNFKHIGEHVDMQWSSWEDFDEIFEGIKHTRFDNGYSKRTNSAWHAPLFLFEKK